MGKGNRTRNQRAAATLATANTRKPAKKQGMPTWVGTLIVLSVLLVLVIFVTVLALSTRGTFARMHTIMESDHYEISAPMMSYLMYSQYQQTVEQNKQYSEQIGYNIAIGGGEHGDALDTTKSLRDQVYERDAEGGNTTMTWFDYFANAAVNQAKQVLVMCEEARYYGMGLSEEDLNLIESELDTIEMYAQIYGYTTSGYVGMMYGSGVQLKDVRNMMKLSQLAAKYAALRLEEFQNAVTADRIDGYYADNKDTYDIYMDYVGYEFSTIFAPSTNKDEAEAGKENTKNHGAYILDQELYADRIAQLEQVADVSEFRSLLTKWLREDFRIVELGKLMDDKEYTMQKDASGAVEADKIEDEAERKAALEAVANAIKQEYADFEATLTSEEKQKLEENVNTSVLAEMKTVEVTNHKKGTTTGDKNDWLFETKTEGEGDAKVTTNVRVVGDKKKFETVADVKTEGDDAYKRVTSTYSVAIVTKTQHRSEGLSVGHILFKADTYKNLTSTTKLTGVAKVLADEVLAAKGVVTSEGMAARLLEILMEEGYITKETDDVTGEEWYRIDEDTFNDFGGYYNEDSNVIYDHVVKGQMVEEFENWLFDEDRKDCEISYPAAVKTDYGHHIMFYLGDSWSREIKNELADADYEEYCDSMLKKYEPSIKVDHKDWKHIAG